jgi:hypothetical protein
MKNLTNEELLNAYYECATNAEQNEIAEELRARLMIIKKMIKRRAIYIRQCLDKGMSYQDAVRLYDKATRKEKK